jgi:hypothetical protein
VVFDKIDLDSKGFPTSVVVGSGGQGVRVKWACVGGYDGECGEGEI